MPTLSSIGNWTVTAARRTRSSQSLGIPEATEASIALGWPSRNGVQWRRSAEEREAALYRLRQLYGVGETWPICVLLHRLWDRDTPGQPLLALLCALARDPSLRAGASAVLDASLGEHVRWPVIAAAFEARHPGRL